MPKKTAMTMSSSTEIQKTKSLETETAKDEDSPLRDIQTTSSFRSPCDVGDDAYIPYWTKENGKLIYGLDKYIVQGFVGCGDVWICHIKDKNGVEIYDLEPNVDVFFSKKDAEKKLNAIKKMEDKKKLEKWKRRPQDKNVSKV